MQDIPKKTRKCHRKHEFHVRSKYDEQKRVHKTYKNPTRPTCVGATIHGYFYSSEDTQHWSIIGFYTNLEKVFRECKILPYETKPYHFYQAMLCIRGTSHGPVSVTSRSSTKTAKHKITQTPHDSPGSLVF